MLTGTRLGRAKMKSRTPKPRSPSASRSAPRLMRGSGWLVTKSRSRCEVRRGGCGARSGALPVGEASFCQSMLFVEPRPCRSGMTGRRIRFHLSAFLGDEFVDHAHDLGSEHVRLIVETRAG